LSWTSILLISAPQVAKIAGMSHSDWLLWFTLDRKVVCHWVSYRWINLLPWYFFYHLVLVFLFLFLGTSVRVCVCVCVCVCV
jgi:hypothetical protein